MLWYSGLNMTVTESGTKCLRSPAVDIPVVDNILPT